MERIAIIKVEYDVEVTEVDVRMVVGWLKTSGDRDKIMQRYFRIFGLSHFDKLKISREAAERFTPETLMRPKKEKDE